MSKGRSKDDYLRSRLSYAHENRTLRQDNALYDKTGRVSDQFDNRTDHTQRGSPVRGSAMIKRQQPKPTLRPPSSMALEPDRAAFNKQLREEDERARRTFLKDAYTEINHLVRAKQQVEGETKTAACVERLARQGRTNEAERETYKAARRLEQIDRNAEDRFQTFFKRHAER